MYTFPEKCTATIRGESIEFAVTGTGTPAVVLVNGSGGPIEGWYKAYPELAKTMRVLAYSRAGAGRSGKPQAAQVGSHLVASLRELMSLADIPRPCVLVGHSFGGLVVNLFARLHPHDVSGVVFLEATTPKDIALLPQLETGVQRTIRRIMDLVAPPHPHGETAHATTTVAELERAPGFPDLPVSVICGGKPGMAWATPRAALEARAAHQRELVTLSPRGKLVMAERSGHFPQFTEPELVVRTIRDVALS